MDARERIRLRFEYLTALYNKVGAVRYNYINKWELGEELKLDRATTVGIIDWLSSEQLVDRTGMLYIGISHRGINVVEEAQSNPNEPTELFPPVINIIRIEKMTDSQIQQGTVHSSQSYTKLSIDSQSLNTAIEQLQTALTEIELDSEIRHEVNVDLETTQKQLQSKAPKIIVLKACLETVRDKLKDTIVESKVAVLLDMLKK